MASYPKTKKREYPYKGIHLRYDVIRQPDGGEILIAKHNGYEGVIIPKGRNGHSMNQMATWYVRDKYGLEVNRGNTSMGWSKDAIRRTFYRLDKGRIE
jgi:hypothetical protein